MATTTTSGLEGVVAFDTQIAEPDRDGGALRYRGIDIADLVGQVPFESVWGLLVDDDISPCLAPLECEVTPSAGDPLSQVQSRVARLSAEWGLGKLTDLDSDAVRADLERASSALFGIVADVAHGSHAGTHSDPSGSLAERFVTRWLGAPDAHIADAIETYWICTAEHGMNASTFTARIVASTGADVGACLASAIGALSGPLHGGAPARVIPMLDEAEALGDGEAAVRAILERGERLMGFGHRVYRAEDPRARLLREAAVRLGAPRVDVALEVERAALAVLRERKPDRVLATNVEYWSAVVLDAAGVPPDLTPALFACSRTAGWSAHILEQHRLGRLVRPAARYVGHAPRPLPVVA